jgi:hypothetical protein
VSFVADAELPAQEDDVLAEPALATYPPSIAGAEDE